MRRNAYCTAAIVGLLLNISAPRLYGADQDERGRAVEAVGKLNDWLGKSANAEQWRKYLALDELAAELARPEQSNKEIVAASLERFRSKAAGLELPQFAAARKALSAWSDELSTPSAGELPGALRAASQAEYTPPSADQVAGAKTALTAALKRLNQYLVGGRANGERWKTYLQWNELNTQLAAETPDLEILHGVYKRFASDQPGLELPIYAKAGDALAAYNSAVEAQQTGDEKTFREQLGQLAGELEGYKNEPAKADAIEIGRRVGWLGKIRPAGPLVRAIRKRFSSPNLFVEIADEIVGGGIARPINELTPITDNILGTSISGTGRTIGRIDVNLVPDSKRGLIDTLLVGTVRTSTVGYNGPATIWSSGTTKIAGRKRLVIDAEGLKSYPATAAATTRTQINGVAAGHGGIVQRIASKRVAESKSQAESIAADHAADRARGRVEAEANKNLLQANTKYQEKFRLPLLRRREFPELLEYSTTKDYLYLRALQADDAQLGAPGEPPALKDKHPMSMRVHESLVNNACGAILAGETITQEKVRRWAEGLPEPNRSDILKRLNEDADQGNWGITFADRRPITVAVADGGVTITIRGKNYLRDGVPFNRPMNVTAHYKFEIAGKGSKLVRQGDLDIAPPKKDGQDAKLTVEDIGLRAKLKRRMDRLFEPEIKNQDNIDNGLQLPGNWKNAGRLALVQLDAASGWLTYGWTHAEPENVAQKQQGAVAAGTDASPKR